MKSANNLVLLTTPIQFVLAICMFIGVTWTSSESQDLDYFGISVFLMCLAAFIENLSEPYYIHMLITGDIRPRVKTECVGILIKSVSTYYLLRNDFNLLAYAISHLLYSLTLVVLYPYLGRENFA